MQNDTMQLEAEMLAHIGACCLESPKGAFVDYPNARIPHELAKHGIAPARAEDSTWLLATTAPTVQLREDSVLLLPLADPLVAFESVKSALQGFGERFSILMPFVLWNLPQPRWFVFASCSVHPLASLRLQCAELLDGLDWYSASMHQAAFVLPPKLARELRGFVRN